MGDQVLGDLPPSSSVIDIFLGPMVVGVMTEQFLLGIICSQAVTYFRYHFSSDHIFCRSIAICLIISSISLGIMDFTSLYRNLVLNYGDYQKFDTQDWIMWTEPGVTAWIAFIAHIFYIFRCWAVTRSPIICMFLGVFSLNSLVSGITITVLDFSLGRMSKFSGVIIPTTVWVVSTSLCDLGIAIVLVVHLRRRRSVLCSIDAMITRLERITIGTGLLTSICMLLNLVLFVTIPNKGYGMVLQYSISRLYTLSVLYTLLGRQDLRNILDKGSGTIVTEFWSSFLAAGVLSVFTPDDPPKGDAFRMQNKTSSVQIVVYGDPNSRAKQSLEEGNV